ncbi:MAG: GTP-binding protein [Planctomycetes bacterium]|nr:GTP-binding protein [Planctomycetota bacterium]
MLTGFLGSGKTALLRALLARTRERIAVLVNEVAELPIDHHLLEAVDEGLLALPGGCVCCTLRGDLHAAFARVVAARPDRVVLETTGLADPAPIVGAIERDPAIGGGLELGGVVAVVDCVRAETLFAEHDEFRRQLDLADRIVLTKTDLAPQREAPVRAWLAEHAPGREVRLARHGEVASDWLFAAPRFAGAGGARAWLERGAEHQHAGFSAQAVRSEHAVDVDALQLWLRLATQLDGERLLRIKAVARCARTGSRFVLQSAGRSVSPPQRLADGGSGAAVAGAEVVVIERGMPAAALAALLAALRSALGIA